VGITAATTRGPRRCRHLPRASHPDCRGKVTVLADKGRRRTMLNTCCRSLHRAASAWLCRLYKAATGHEETMANLPPMSADDPCADALLAAGLIHERD
jgi:hypothetical protein